MEIIQASTAREFEAARSLFTEYSRALGVDLCFQSFDKELASLETMYAAPGGALLLLNTGEGSGDFAGCAGVRKLGDHCEMKRLYVQPRMRGQGAGRRMADAICEKARALGYSRIYLDTLPSMTEARQLYNQMGFVETEPYYMNPIEGVTYMVKNLY